MMKKEKIILYISTIFILVTGSGMIFSTNILIRIICAILFISYITYQFIIKSYKHRKIISTLNLEGQSYSLYKDNNFTSFLVGFTFILNFSSKLSNLFYEKNMELFLSGNQELNNYIEYIKVANWDDKEIILVYLCMAVIGIISIVEYLLSKSIICNDKIYFYDGSSYTLNEITCIEHKNAIFSSKKIITIHTKSDEHQIVVKDKYYIETKALLEKYIIKK